MKTIKIFGGNGQHASDLLKRGIFNDFSSEIIEKNTKYALLENVAIIVPISATKELAEEVLLNAEGDTMNFAGIMSTTPKNGESDTTNFHFLFGPNAKTGLKLAVAGNISQSAEQIIENAQNKSIQIIETSIEEHDSLMAIIQGLTHLMILLSGLNDRKMSPLLHEWKTPSGTITDMIFNNPFFENIGFQFFQAITKDGTNISEIFSDICSTYISDTHSTNFGTPTFKRVTTFCKEKEVTTNQAILDFIENDFSDRKKIESIVQKLQSHTQDIS